MSELPIMRFAQHKPFVLVMLLAIVVVVAKAIVTGRGMEANFSTMGPDDVTRLLMVRDWIGGQSWFDTTQYRLAPPEGVSIHWSRYIDAGIAAIILPLSEFLPMETAEQVAATIWPTLVFVITLLVMGFGTRRLFGTKAACFAVLCTAFWPLTADSHSRAGNLDHHNVQLLMMIIVALAVVWPSRPIAAGAVGGLAAAFSLAVGLETLLFVVGAGLLVFLRCVFARTAMAARLLVAFCIVLLFGSLLFWLGQTAPDARSLPVCDQLGTPILSLVAVAATASVLPLVLRKWLQGPVAHIAGTSVLTAAGLVLVWPLLAVCLEGPYGNLSVELQTLISTRIIEAKPALVYAQSHAVPAFVFLLPVLTALGTGFALWYLKRKDRRLLPQKRAALGSLLVLCLIGLAMVFYQMRTVIMVASVVPIIGGVVLAALLERYLATRHIWSAVAMFVIAIAVVSPKLYLQPFADRLVSDNGMERQSRVDCRAHATLQVLNAVPPGRFLTHGNIGPSLVWATHHSSLSALYHRSAPAMSNALLPWRMDAETLADYVTASNATHLLLCNGSAQQGPFATALIAGEVRADWLRPVALDSEHVRLYEIIR